MQYTETELSDLIKSVEAEFSAHLSLKKSEDFPPKKEKPEDEEGEKEKSHEEPKEEAAPEKEEGEKSEGEGEKHAEHEEGEKPEGEKHEEGHDEDAHDYDDEDMAQMHEMYSSMKKGELKAHHDCIKKCLDAHKEGPAMEKSEKAAAIEIPAVNNEEIALLKSEVKAEKAKADELKKSLDMVTELLTKMVGKTAPKAKAVTELQVINKSEEVKANDVKSLSKKEVTEKLNKAASRPDLAKSDRDAINAFYLSSNPNIESISHLLK
jgi:hypothetical protein